MIKIRKTNNSKNKQKSQRIRTFCESFSGHGCWAVCHFVYGKFWIWTNLQNNVTSFPTGHHMTLFGLWIDICAVFSRGFILFIHLLSCEKRERERDSSLYRESRLNVCFEYVDDRFALRREGAIRFDQLINDWMANATDGDCSHCWGPKKISIFTFCCQSRVLYLG